MKKYFIFFTLFFIGHVYALPNPTGKMNARITVFNLTNNQISIRCELLQNNASMYPTGNIAIVSGNSPVVDLTYQEYGKLIKCYEINGPAWFIYSVKPHYREGFEISRIAGKPNFHYDKAYQGALTYS